MSEKEELVFNIITLGNSGVGKTSIIRRYVYNSFEEKPLLTIGLQFAFKNLTLKSKKTIKLKLIDTAGQEKYRSLSKSYYKNADAVLFIFSFEDLKSFEEISGWIKEFKDCHHSEEKILKYLIGNKNDLTQKVNQELIDELKKSINI